MRVYRKINRCTCIQVGTKPGWEVEPESVGRGVSKEERTARVKGSQANGRNISKNWSKEPNAQEESKIGTEEGQFELF